MAEPSPPATSDDDGKPLLFISHRHDDKTIADVLRSFIVTRTANQVAVAQTSSPAGEGPSAGGPLNRQLMGMLWRADVFLLLHTNPRSDWSWCCWEYGVALDKDKPDTRAVVLQFTDQCPPLFNDLVRVDVRRREDVTRFTQDLLCGRDFFPERSTPITGFKRESEDVKRAADELYDSLQAVAPQGSEDPDPWPAYPYMQLQIGLDHIAEITAAPELDRPGVARAVLETKQVVIDGDAEAGRLFGRRERIKGEQFSDLLGRWKDRYPDSETCWVDTIASQIAAAAVDDFPTLDWELMRARDRGDTTWYGPALIQVQSVPRQQVMRFDVCFLKFGLDGDGLPIVRVPKA